MSRSKCAQSSWAEAIPATSVLSPSPAVRWPASSLVAAIATAARPWGPATFTSFTTTRPRTYPTLGRVLDQGPAVDVTDIHLFLRGREEPHAQRVKECVPLPSAHLRLLTRLPSCGDRTLSALRRMSKPQTNWPKASCTLRAISFS
eukprot:scaffold5321_cov366-Prasinococcus_capsulatus_cf.AAC.9